MGFTLLEQLPISDPDDINAIYKIMFAMSLFLLLLLLFPTFVAIKVDGGLIDWSWSAVLWPLWVLNVPYGLSTLSELFVPLETQEEEDLETASLDSSLPQTRKVTKAYKVKVAVKYICVILIQILVVSKLDGNTTAPLLACLAPWWVFEAIQLIPRIAQIKLVLDEINKDESRERPVGKVGIFLLFVGMTWGWFIRVIQVFLIAFKVDELTSMSWVLVFIPVYVVGAKRFLSLVIQFMASRAPEDPAIQDALRKRLLAQFVLFFIGAGVFYSLLGLLIHRLENGSGVSLAVVFIPLFVALSILFLCACCCLPLQMHFTFMDLESRDIIALADPNHRIEYRRT
jgi:hypothetical protein